MLSRLAILTCAAVLAAPAPAAEGRSAETLYRDICSVCHGQNRLGGVGPALLPQNLKRLRKKAAARVITSGAPATQMPAFGDQLSSAEIDALVAYIYTPLDNVPPWGEEQIRASNIRHLPDAGPEVTPAYDADVLNLFVVVEAGDHHATILNGDTFEPIHRFKTRHALHGGPKFTSDGRYVYFASRDGWVSKFDMYTLTTVVETRAGINTRNIAVSSDNRYVMVGNYLPHNLVLLDAMDLSVIRVIPVEDGFGNTSRVSAVYDAPPRQSFIAALKDLTEVWEIPYMDDPPVYGWQHDHRYEKDEPVKFPVRRIPLDDYLDDFFFDQTYDYLIGAARNAKNGQVVDLVVGKKVADIDLPGMPHLGSGITWRHGDGLVLASPNLKEGVISIIDMDDWKTIDRIDTLGPGFFMRSHRNSPYAWVDVFFGPNKDVVHVIDKQTFEIVKTLKPAPGKTAAHVEFTRDGSHALLSIWDIDGALVIYDAKSLEEVKRLPMVKPSGKYNVYNKITKEEGTSH